MSDRWSKFSAISETISSLAILVTLIFLFIQAKQNTDAINAQLEANKVEASAAIYDLAFKALDYRMNSPRIGENLHSSDTLSIIEAWELDGYMQTLFIAREFVWLRYKDGSIDTVTFETMMRDLSYFLSNPRLNEWWKKNAERVFEEDFIKYVNSRSKE